MRQELIPPFIHATTEVMETMASATAEVGDVCKKEDKAAFGDVSGIIGLMSESIAGNLVISFEQATILDIVYKMLGETHQDIDQDVVDAVGELTNMICGVAKRGLSEIGVEISMATPSVFLGRELKLTRFPAQETTLIPFNTEAGKFILEVNINLNQDSE